MTGTSADRLRAAVGGRRQRLTGWWIAAGILALLIAAPFVLTTEPPAPSQGWHINVRWAPNVTDPRRHELETTFGLLLPQPHAERTWVYRLRNPSRANIRALVMASEVEDTQGIDRQTFRVTVPRVTLARRYADTHPAIAARLRRSLKLQNVVIASAAALVVMILRRPKVTAMLGRGIPPLSASAFGAYRFVFGLAMMRVLAKYDTLPDAPFPRELHRSQDWFANWDWVHAFASRPGIDHWTLTACLVLLAFFTIGLATRLSYFGFLAVLTVHVLIVLQHKSAHDWGLPLVTLWGLAIVPWGEGVGLHAWRSRAPISDGNYGFAVWFPGLMIGLAFAAAAYAKLNSSGIAWVTGGAVKYHFLEDWRQAPTDWGLWIASHDHVAVAMSAAAILVEGLFVLNVLARCATIRAAFALAGLSLLLGFRLLQGVFWIQWYVLFLCFVPWQLIVERLLPGLGSKTAIASAFRRTNAPLASAGLETGASKRANISHVAATALTPVAATLVAVLAGIQVIASGKRLEAEPFISDYGMYSWTWPSREAFDAQLARKYRRYSYRQWLDGRASDDVTQRVSQMPKAGDQLAEVVDLLRAGKPVGDTRKAALAAFALAYRDQYGVPLTRLLVLVDERAFDWARGRFYVKSDHRPIGILDAVRCTLAPLPQEAPGHLP
jgi:hypothetical protein